MKTKCPSYAGNVYFIVNGQEANGGVLANASAQQLLRRSFHYGGDIADYVPWRTNKMPDRRWSNTRRWGSTL